MWWWIFLICYKNNNKVADYLSKNHFKGRLPYLTNQEKCFRMCTPITGSYLHMFPTQSITPNGHKLDSISSQNIVQGVDRAILVWATTKQFHSYTLSFNVLH